MVCKEKQKQKQKQEGECFSDSGAESQHNEGDKKVWFRSALRDVNSMEQAIKLIQCNHGKLSQLELIPLEDGRASAPLTNYRVDSIGGIDLRKYITSEMAATLGLQDLLTSPTIAELSEHIANLSSIDPLSCKRAET
ncbi:hypothetical protein N7541_001779 [Penicillium brevicompactum]|uniref:Carrier domain-containing protein n=1 Tax=Penicillium brevicompactum TaxID=5074 RepID=A0A9W9V3S1_PENBR|nr:hypothetical protein N7541_001779 [Penicillium brevicompactum]